MVVLCTNISEHEDYQRPVSHDQSERKNLTLTEPTGSLSSSQWVLGDMLISSICGFNKSSFS